MNPVLSRRAVALFVSTCLFPSLASCWSHPLYNEWVFGESSQSNDIVLLALLAGNTCDSCSGSLIQVSSFSGQTDESGASHIVSVSLAEVPQGGSVTLSASSSDATEGVVTPTTMTFDGSNFDTAQSFTITGQADGVYDLRQSYTVTLTSSSTASNFPPSETFAIAMTNLSSEKHMFVSNTFTAGDMSANGEGLTGLAGADRICELDLHNPNNGADYDAFITQDGVRQACSTANCGGGATENINWILSPNTTYFRTDEYDFDSDLDTTETALIATTNAAGIFAFPISTGFTPTSQRHKTGMGTTWMPDGGRDCNDWQSPGPTGPPFGRRGDLNRTNDWLIDRGVTPPCGTLEPVLCVEQ